MTGTAFRILLISDSHQLRRIFGEVALRHSVQVITPEKFEHVEFSITSDKVGGIFADASFPGLSRQRLMLAVKNSPVNSRAVVYLITGLGRAEDPRPHEQGFLVIQKPSSAADIEPIFARLKAKLVTERRRTGRLPFRTAVQGHQGPRHFQATSTNLSAQGIMLEATTPLERGAEFDLRFLLEPDTPVINCRGRVMRIQGPGRYGVNFVSLDQFTRQRLQKYLDIHLPARRTDESRA